MWLTAATKVDTGSCLPLYNQQLKGHISISLTVVHRQPSFVLGFHTKLSPWGGKLIREDQLLGGGWTRERK